MDPTSTVPPPPPPPSQNHDTPPDALMETDKSTNRNMDNFKALVFKLTEQLLPAHQSLVEQRFDGIVQDQLSVPDHPPYDYMILTALWELESEGGSSKEAISQFIKTRYRELPWAHATILSHHLKYLCKQGKISMTRDGCYTRCSQIIKTEPSLSPSSSPLSSTCSSSSTSITSSSSSSSEMSWGGRRRTKKRKDKKGRRGRKVKVRVTDRGRGRGRGRPNIRGRFDVEGCNKLKESEQQTEDQNEVTVNGRGRGRLRRDARGRFDVKGRNKLKEPEQQTEYQNEVAVMEVEDNATKDQNEVTVSGRGRGRVRRNVRGRIDVEGHDKLKEPEQQTEYQNEVAVVEVENNATKDGDLRDLIDLNVQFDDEVTALEADVSHAKVDEHAKQPKKGTEVQNEVTVNGVEDHATKDGDIRDVIDLNVQFDADVSDDKVDEHVEQPEKGIEDQNEVTVVEVEDHATKDGDLHDVDDLNVPFDDKVDEYVEQPGQGTEDQNEGTVVEVEDNATKDKDLPDADDVIIRSGDDVTVLKVNVSNDKVDGHVEQPEQETEDQNEVTVNGVEDHATKDGDLRDVDGLKVQFDDKVNVLETDVSDDKVDEHVEQPEQETGNQNEVTVMEVEGYTTKDGDLPDADDLRVQFDVKVDKHVEQPEQGTEDQNEVTAMEVEDHATKEDDVIVQSGDVTLLEVSVSDAKVDEHVEQLKPNKEKRARDTEHNQESDIVKGQTLGEEQLIDDENPSEEQDSVLNCSTKEQEETTEQSADLHHDDATEQPIRPQEQCVEKTEESPRSSKQVLETESAEQEEHQTEVDQGKIMLGLLAKVRQEAIVEKIKVTEQQNQHTEKSEEGLLKEKDKRARNENIMTSSGSATATGRTRRPSRPGLRSSSKKEDSSDTEISEEESHEVKDNRARNENLMTTSGSATATERTRRPSRPGLRSSSKKEDSSDTVITEEDSHEEKDNRERNENLMTSSSRTTATERTRRPSRPGLRSSSKKEDATPNSKEQLELVTPVRRILRSNKTGLEVAEKTEVPDHSKEQVTHSGRTRSSKRKQEIAEAEQVSNRRRTRSTGL